MRFPGMTLTYALLQMVLEVSERGDKARIITKERAHNLLMNNTNLTSVIFAGYVLLTDATVEALQDILTSG